MLILKYVAKLLKALTSGESPKQLAGGLILGMVLGLVPFGNLISLFIIVLIILINVNVSMAILGFAVFKGIAYLLDPVFHDLGYQLLVNTPALKGIWTSLYNSPVFVLTNFNNTVVLGSFLISLVLLLPVFFLAKVGVVQYREKIHARVVKWKIIQIMKSTKLYSIYENIDNWRN